MDAEETAQWTAFRKARDELAAIEKDLAEVGGARGAERDVALSERAEDLRLEVEIMRSELAARYFSLLSLGATIAWKAGQRDLADDLSQEAWFGLRIAVDRFVASRGHPFARYAKSVIRNAVYNSAELGGRRPRYLGRVRTAHDALLIENPSRAPTPAEIAARATVTTAQVEHALDWLAVHGTEELIDVDLLSASEDGYKRVEDRLYFAQEVAPHFNELPAEKQIAIAARYGDNLEPQEIARREGVAPTTIRKRLFDGLKELKRKVAPPPDTRHQDNTRTAADSAGAGEAS